MTDAIRPPEHHYLNDGYSARSWLLTVDHKRIAVLYLLTITFFFATHLFPGRAPRVMDFRATDDRFVIAIDAKGNIPHEEITNILKEAGAVEIKHNDRKYVSYE